MSIKSIFLKSSKTSTYEVIDTQFTEIFSVSWYTYDYWFKVINIYKKRNKTIVPVICYMVRGQYGKINIHQFTQIIREINSEVQKVHLIPDFIPTEVQKCVIRKMDDYWLK